MSSAIDLPCPLSPDASVWEQHEVYLRTHLENGWRLPTILRRNGRSEIDISLPLRVVTRGWAEGWAAFVEVMPALRESKDLWHAALRHASVEIVRDLSKVHDVEKPDDEGWYPIHHALAELFSSLGTPIAWEQIQATVTVLVEAGARLDTPYPSLDKHSVPHGLSLGGHTAWTLALNARAWDLAAAWTPISATLHAKHPRAHEMLWRTVERAERGHPAALTALVPWMRVLGKSLWQETEVGVGTAEGIPQPGYPAFHAPLFWSTHLTHKEKVRKALWRRWSVPDSIGWTSWHHVASAAAPSRHDDVVLLLETCVQDMGEQEVVRWWHAADEDGVSPAYLWDLTYPPHASSARLAALLPKPSPTSTAP